MKRENQFCPAFYKIKYSVFYTSFKRDRFLKVANVMNKKQRVHVATFLKVSWFILLAIIFVHRFPNHETPIKTDVN